MPTITFDFRVKQNADGTFDAHVTDQDIHIKSVESQGTALDEALRQLNEMWNGIIQTADEKQLVFSTSVVSLRISIEMSPNANRSLSEFANNTTPSEEEDPQEPQLSTEEPQLSTEEPQSEPNNPVTDYQNGIPEALALMEMLKINCGGEISQQEAADVCTSITDIDGTPLSLDAVRNRYSGILVDSVALLVDEDSEGNPQTCEMIQFTYEFPDTDDDTGEHLYRVMQAAANPSEEAEE